MRMPRIWLAACFASSGPAASLIPPALPRLPVGTCAFTTQGPIFAAAIAASAALMQSVPRGTGMPAGVKTSDFAAYSSKFMPASQGRGDPSLSVFLPVRAEQLVLARLVFRDGGDEVGDVEKVHVVEIVGDRISAPGAAAHAEREIKPVVEAAAIAERVRLVDQHAHDVRTLGQRARTAHVLGVQADRMATALVRENFVGARDGGVEIPGAVDGEHQRKLLARERKAAADTGFLDHEELLRFSRRRQTA